MRLRALAPGKVNLTLCLGPTRADGRHDLVTVLESLSLADELVLESLADGHEDEVICEGVEGENLVHLALAGLRQRGWDGPAVRIEVTKRIPVAAGMGGGSADAAAALRMAVEIAPGRPEEVMELAASLGADVPSQVAPGLVLGTGAGDVTEPFPPLAPQGVVIVPLPVALSTADVYREADRLGLSRSPVELDVVRHQLTLGFSTELIVNDLEPAALSLAPRLGETLGAVLRAGADNAIICGSGPTVIGLFWGDDGSLRAREAAAQLRGEHPAVLTADPVRGGDNGLAAN